MGDGSRCHGQRPSISNTSVQLRKMRISTSPSQQNEAYGCQLMRYGFHDIGGHQHFEAKQERAADADLVDLGLLLRVAMESVGLGSAGARIARGYRLDSQSIFSLSGRPLFTNRVSITGEVERA
jgi:hypothetical protein